MKLNKLKLVSASWLLMMLAWPIVAYQVQPMMVEITSQGKQSMVTYRLQNPGDAPLPVEVEVYKRTFDENLKEVLVSAEEDFIVLPPQIEVPANGFQVFRAKYLGQPDLKQTSSYRIVFKQLPLSDKKQSTGVKMMFNFATLVFVNPQGVAEKAQSTLNCAQANTADKQPQSQSQSAASCQVVITNKGKKVMDLTRFDYQIELPSGSKTIPWPEFQTVTKGRFIMPEHHVTLDITPLLGGETAKTFTMVDLFNRDED